MGSGIERFLQDDPQRPKSTAADRFSRWEGAPDTARLKLSLTDAQASAPDTSARVLKAAQRTGLPADVVARNLDDVERDLRNVESEDFQRRFPRIASWLAENPHHATIATNDLERLARLEATIANSAPPPREKAGGLRNFGKGLGLGIINLESGVGHSMEALGQTLRSTPGVGPAKAIGAAQVVIGDYLRKDAKPAAEFYQPRAASMADIQGQGDLRDFIAFQAGQGIGTMAPMVVSGAAGVVGTATTSGALNYGDVRDELETLAPEMAIGVRNALALALAVPITAIDILTPGQIAAKLIVRKVAKPFVTEAAKHGLTRAVLGEFLKTGAKEGGQEFVQEVGQYVGTRAVTGTPMTLAEGAVRGADAFVGGALGGATFGAVGAIGERAQQNAAVIQALDDVTKDAELPALMVEKAEEVIERATAGASVYVPIGDWQEFHQGVGLDPGVEAERVLGDRAPYEEAIRTGEDMAIPMARYAVRVSSEHKAKLKDVVRVALDAMNAKESAEAVKQTDAAVSSQPVPVDPNANESGLITIGFEGHVDTASAETLQLLLDERTAKANELKDRINSGTLPENDVIQYRNRLGDVLKDMKFLKARIEGPKVVVDPAEQSAQAVADEVTKQLVAAGVPEAEAATNAGLYSAAFRAFGQRAGVDPMTLFRRYNPTINAVADPNAPAPVGAKISLEDVARRAIDYRVSQAEKAAEREAIEGEPSEDEAPAATDPYRVRDQDRDANAKTETGEFVYARTPAGTVRSNLAKVSISGIADEMGRLFDANAMENTAMTAISDTPSTPTSHGYTYVGHKGAAAHAMGRVASRKKSIAKLEAELERRGVTDIGELLFKHMSRAEDAAAFEFFQSAYHGSPHIFDKFTTDKMGTGEGAQAFGYGLYFASLREIAAHYRDKLSTRSRGGLSLAGVVPPTPQEGLSDATWIAAKELSQLLVSKSAGIQSFGEFNVERRRQMLAMMMTLLEDHKVLDTVVGFIPVDVVDVLAGKKYPPEYLLHHPSVLVYLLSSNTDNPVPGSVPAVDVLAAAVALAAAKVHTGLARFDVTPSDFLTADGTLVHTIPESVSSKIPQPSEFRKGRLYKVEIPEDNTYLDWDKPLSEQSEHVKAALAKAGIKLRGRGQDLYSDLVQDLRDKASYVPANEAQAFAAKHLASLGIGATRLNYVSTDEGKELASRYLASLGINGIRFLDQGSRAKGAGSHNYVVFDDKLIQIQEYEQRDERAVQRYLLWAAAADDPALAPELRAHARRKADEFKPAATATRQAEIDEANTEQAERWQQQDERTADAAQDRRLEAVAAGEGMAGVYDQTVAQTETPAFKAWFGDSKVVDEQGKPLVVYHGTQSPNDFDSFLAGEQPTDESGDSIDSGSGGDPSARLGSSFAVEPGVAGKFATLSGVSWLRSRFVAKGATGPRVYPVFLSIQNPKRFRDDEALQQFIYQQPISSRAIDEELDDMADADGTESDELGERYDSDVAFREEVNRTVADRAMRADEPDGSVADDLAIAARAAMESQGFDGIVHRNTVEGGTSYIAFQPEQIKSAIGNRGTFDPSSPNILYQEVPQTTEELDAAIERQFSEGQPDELRGRIRIGPAGVAIDLFKAKNLSTFLHETGHFYLHILGDLARDPDVDASVKADFDTIKMWLGKDDDTPFTREQHEQFARGFEAYLMEGKSPSPGLRTAFARFRAWLVSVYRQIKALNVTVSPEVSAVFDRMLATADEIDAARSQQNMNALDPVALGFDDAQTQKYLAAVEVERARAEEELSAQLMDEYNRTRTAIWQAERDGIRAEVADEINTERDSIAYAMLTRGTKPDGSPLPDGSAFKINAASIKAHVAPGVLKSLPRPYIYAKDGEMPIEAAAEHLGYDSADALIKALLATENPKSRIERLTDQRMVEEHGLLTEAELPVEAMHAVHSEYRSKRLRMELEGLASNNLPALKGLVRAIAKRRIPQADALRAQAEATIAAKRTSEINPLLYQRAEARAAKAALDALLKGDVELAFQEKSREWLNHELYRAAVEARETVGKIRDEAVRLFRPDEQMAKSRDMDFVNAARAVAASFGLGSSTKPALSHLEGVRQYDPDLYATLAALVNDATDGAQDYRAATYADLLQMREAMNALWTLSRSTRQHEVDGQKLDREEVQETLAARLRTIGLDHLKRGYQKAATEWEKTKVGLMGMRAALRRVESWVDAVDGGDPNGAFRRLFFNPVRESIDRFRIAERAARTQYLGVVKALEPSLKAFGARKIEASEIGYTFGSKAELLGALLHTGNESNFDKLLRGRNWTAVGWESFIRRMQATGVLTKLDYDYAQAVWDLFESLKPGAQKAHHAMYGYYFSEITAQEVQTPFGTYRGGYVPARVDPFTSSDAQARADKEALEKENNSFAFPTTGRGFTKSRVQAYARPLLMDLRMVPAHLNWMLRFTHIEPHVKSVSRMLWNRDFRETLDGFDPTVVSDLLIPWLQRSARQTMATPGANRTLDRFFTHLRTNSAMGAMVGNVVNTIQQLTGFSISMVKVKPRYLRDALWRYTRNPKAVSDDITERSEFMATRMHTQVDKVQSDIDDILLNPSKYEEVRDFARRHGYILQSTFQNLVDHVTWTGAYDQAIANGANERDAVREADSVVRLTQGSFNPEDASRFETGTPFMRLFSMFYGYFNMQANLLGSEFTIAMREMGLKKGAGRMLYVYTFGFLTVAVLSKMIVLAGRGEDFDEDDDGYMDDLLGLFFGAQWETATAFVPGVGAVARGFTNALNDKWYDDRLSVSPAVTAIESLWKGPISAYKAIVDGKSKKAAVRDMLTMLNTLSGVPVAFLARPAGYLLDVQEGKARPESAYDFARGLVTGRTGTR